jgi:S1-C subfamily serine protease
MGADEGFDDDGPDFRPPLPQEDRLWRHPAEVGAAALLANSTRAGNRNPWAVGFVSAIGGVLLAGSLMFGVGGVGEEPGRIALTPIATLVPNVETVADTGGDAPSNYPYIVGVDSTSPTAVRSGNGVALRADGYLVTTASLVADATAVRVTLDGGAVYAGRVVGVDSMNDLAVVKVDTTFATVATFAAPGSTQVGDQIQVVGAARGVRSPAWQAMVSSIDGSIAAGHCDLHGAIEVQLTFDDIAAGAPALDADGNVVGIASTTGGPLVDSGLVIPARSIKSVVDQLIATGSARHGWLGVEGVSATTEQAKAAAAPSAAVVRRVIDSSPASTAGLKAGDLVVSVNGETITTMGRLVMIVREQFPGTAVAVDIVRDGKRQTTSIALGAIPAV